MAEYAGSALSLVWVYSGGTVSLAGDFRTFTSSPQTDLYEQTAGSDQYKTYIAGVRTLTCDVSLVAQADGTVLVTALREATPGTLTVGPEGTATGKIKEIYPCFSMGIVRNQPYNNVVEYNVTFQMNGQPSYTVF
jgi:hypothetical protein